MKSNQSIIRILIAEDHLIARLGMAAILDAQTDMRIVGEAMNGQEAVALFRKLLPDIALIDVRMPVMSGLQAAREIRSEFPDAHLIAISTFGGDHDIRTALAAGMRAYLNKDVLSNELIDAIRVVHSGRTYLTNRVTSSLATQTQAPDLSPREIEVLNLIVQGLSNKQISYTLGIADYTVKNHVKSILNKLKVEDRTHATSAAIQRGIIHLDD